MNESKPNPELEVYATAVHGMVMAGNFLGLMFNLKRRNWRWVMVHAAGLAAHAVATRGHAKNLNKK